MFFEKTFYFFVFSHFFQKAFSHLMQGRKQNACGIYGLTCRKRLKKNIIIMKKTLQITKRKIAKTLYIFAIMEMVFLCKKKSEILVIANFCCQLHAFCVFHRYLSVFISTLLTFLPDMMKWSRSLILMVEKKLDIVHVSFMSSSDGLTLPLG